MKRRTENLENPLHSEKPIAHTGKNPAGPLKNRSFLPIILVFAVALVIRLLYLSELRSAPFFHHPVGDSRIYHERALSIASGDIVGREAYFHSSPLYPYFLALIYTLFGPNLTLVRIFQFVIGALNCVLVFKLTEKLPGKGGLAPILAGMMAAFYGAFVFFDGDLLMITLVLFSVCTSLLLLIDTFPAQSSHQLGKGKSLKLPEDGISSGRTMLKAFVSGMFLGMAGLGKPNVLVFAPFALIWIVTAFRKVFYVRRLREGGLFALGCLLAVYPITLRNYMISRDFVLVSSNAGVNFFIGNNEDASGVFFLPPGSGLDNRRLYLSSKESAERATGISNMKPSQVSGFWTGRALSFIKRHPADEVKLLLHKLYLFWNSYEIPNHHDFHFMSIYYAGILKYLIVRFSWIVPLALAGMLAMLWRYGSYPSLRLMISFIIVYMIFLIPFFITARYRLPVVPLLIVFAGLGVREVCYYWKAKDKKKLALLAAVVTASMVAVNLPAKPFDFGFMHTVMGTVYSDLATEKQKRSVEFIRKAILEYKKALELRPLSVDAHYDFGLALQRIGFYSKAIDEFATALKLDPNHLYAGSALAKCKASLEKTGDKTDERILPLTPFEMGLKFGSRGDDFLARRQYEKALDEDPHHALALSELGAIRFDEGDYKGAIKLFKQGLRYRPESFVLHNNIAGAYYRLGKKSKAKDHWLKCLEIDPKNKSVKRQLALIKNQ